ncbi:NAD(P)-binding protein [Auriscalpium vulgare]|uniref:NAD(P)-binding protein n=1 Tax=Auriscalpium vulgare TaxID=40419 RepID=A0ACB8RUA8_9AGAM|nr:NAD(P)-binding protein [Auriscalpium vulgare]
MAGKSVLIFGATGQTGGYLLRELLDSSVFTRVGEAGRRLTPLEDLPANATAKLEQKTVDFENIEAAALHEGKWDVVFITMGTSRKSAGSAANFEKIDREYVLNAAKAVKTDGEQRIVYCSTGASNIKSPFLYLRSKALTEQGLADLGYSDTIVFQPGFLRNTKRPDFRPLDLILGPVFTLLSYLPLSLEIGVDKLAKSMCIAGELGSAKLPARAEATKLTWDTNKFTVIGNKGSLLLAN